MKLGTDLASIARAGSPTRSIRGTTPTSESEPTTPTSEDEIYSGPTITKILFYDTTSKKTAGQKGTIGFDLDDTLVYKNHRVLPYVREKLVNLSGSGFNIVVITNQSARISKMNIFKIR